MFGRGEDKDVQKRGRWKMFARRCEMFVVDAKKGGVRCRFRGVRCLWPEQQNLFQECLFLAGPGPKKEGFLLHFCNVILLAREKRLV